ncbi:hypothetical protein INR49_016237 [Caranx melampygus]|nr:hypothetical protein INR49_016237 [Caranx melampygus]
MDNSTSRLEPHFTEPGRFCRSLRGRILLYRSSLAAMVRPGHPQSQEPNTVSVSTDAAAAATTADAAKSPTSSGSVHQLQRGPHEWMGNGNNSEAEPSREQRRAARHSRAAPPTGGGSKLDLLTGCVSLRKTLISRRLL